MHITITPSVSSDSGALAVTEIARTLGLGRPQATRLIEDGWTPPNLTAIAALALRGTIGADEPLAAVRLGKPGWDDGRRIGLAADYSDSELVEAARQWWTGPSDRVVAGGHLLVVVAGFIVALLGIDGIEATCTVDGLTRKSFGAHLIARVDDLPSATIRSLQEAHPLVRALGYRVPPLRGAPLVIIPPESEEKMQDSGLGG